MIFRFTNFLISLTNILLSIVGFFLGMRILLEFISVNPVTPIVAWIYSVGQFFMSPFIGIAPNFSTGVGTLDIVALIALVVYSLLGYLLTEVFRRLALASSNTMVSAHYHDIEDEAEDEDLSSSHRDRRQKRSYL